MPSGDGATHLHHVMTEPLGERVATLQAYYIQFGEDLKEIREHLATLNGSVAENSKFRVQSKAVLAAFVFGWASIFLPLMAILVAILIGVIW